MMHRRFMTYSRTEPARTILWIVALLTLLAQALACVLAWPYGLVNFALVAPVCIWGIVASYRNNMKHMSLSSFWLFVLWLWSGLSRLAFSPDPGLLLWVPFLVVAVTLSVVYLYMAFQQRAGTVNVQP